MRKNSNSGEVCQELGCTRANGLKWDWIEGTGLPAYLHCMPRSLNFILKVEGVI